MGGSLTFLMTDVEGSTRLWEAFPEQMSRALARHDELVHEQVRLHGGQIVKARGEGDSAFCVFEDAGQAASSAVALQRFLLAEPWPAPVEIRVRMALHTGPAELRLGDFYGPEVNRCARLRAAGHGGQVLASEETVLAVGGSSDGLTFEDLGMHRLRDLSRPVRVFQASTEGSPTDFPPLLSLDARANNLPLQVTSFVGRDEEVQEVTALLDTDRLVTVTGVGGVGKTRLSLHVAATRIERYRDGVWLVELGPVSDDAGVVGTVARTLGVREDASRTLEEAVLDACLEREQLLILDNCEHLIDAVARFTMELLRRCAGVSVLATSREPLGIGGEAIWRARSLAVPNGDSLEGAATSAAVRLFIDRATLVQPAFVLGPDNVKSVELIVTRLDGIPLAIELAAARTGSLSPAEIGTMLDDRFRLLTGNARARLERHQTMRATIDWSYRLLGADEAAVLRSVATFASPFQIEAAAALSARTLPETLDVISHLVDRSLVVAEPDIGRYRLLETVRAFARELLTTEESAALRVAHFRWFAARANDMDAGFNAGRQEVWLGQVDGEHEDLIAALTWATSPPRHAAEGLEMATALSGSWALLGRIADRTKWLTAFLDDGTTPARIRARALRNLGQARLLQGPIEEALPHARAALALNEADDDPAGIMGSLSLVGHIEMATGDYPAAAEHLSRALEGYREAQDAVHVGDVLISLGQTVILRGDHLEAVPLLEEALKIFRPLEHANGMRLALNQLGYAHLPSDRAAARRAFSEALEVARRMGAPVPTGWQLVGLGQLLLGDGDLDSAGRSFQEALDLLLEAGDAPGAKVPLLLLARVALGRGDLVETRRLLSRFVLPPATQRNIELEALDTLASLELEEGNLEAATAAAHLALTGWVQLGARYEITSTLSALGWIAYAEGAHERAAVLFGAAAAEHPTSGFDHPVERRHHEGFLARVREALGDEAFERAFHRGGQMTLEHATDVALGSAPDLELNTPDPTQ